MRTLYPRTFSAIGVDAVPLHTLAACGDFSLESNWPGGCQVAQFSFAADPTFSHRGLTPGRLLRIYDHGWPVWYGRLTDPEIDNPWTIHAEGGQAFANNFACLDVNGFPTWDPNDAIAQAIVRGLQWNPLTAPASLPAPDLSVVTLHSAASIGSVTIDVTLSSGLAPAQGQALIVASGGNVDYVTVTAASLSGSVYTLSTSPFAFAHANGVAARMQPAASPGQLADLLNHIASMTGERWGVDAHGVCSMTFDNDAVPTYYVLAVDKPGGRTIDNYITAAQGIFIDKNHGGQIRPVSVAAPTPLSFAPNEQPVDLTPLGGMTLTQAQSRLAGVINNASVRAFFTGTVEIQNGNLVTVGGIPVPLTVPQPNDCVTFLDVQPDPQYGEPTYSNVVTVPIGYLNYAGNTDTLQLAPANHDLRDLTSVLAAATAAS